MDGDGNASSRQAVSHERRFSQTHVSTNKIMREGVKLTVQHLYNAGDTAVAELLSTSTARDGQPFNNT